MKLSLAPIQGMTIAYYRNLYAEFFGGIDTYYAPFIDTRDPKKSSPALYKDLLPENNIKELHLIPQLLGNNGHDFRYFASKFVDMGYPEINWNIGCPFPMVTNKKKGSGILPYPEMIECFLDEVCKDESYDLTVKMRLGLNQLEEGIQVIDLLNKYPLKKVILHGRTGVQKYAGHVDLDAFEVLYSACKHSVVYNGDIFTLEDFNNIQSRFPLIQEFMLGRGALRDPFLPSTIKENPTSADEKLIQIKAFHEAAFKHYESILSGDKHLCDKMKEFWSYTSVHIDTNGKFMKKISKCRTSDNYLEVVNQMLNSSTSWK